MNRDSSLIRCYNSNQPAGTKLTQHAVAGSSKAINRSSFVTQRVQSNSRRMASSERSMTMQSTPCTLPAKKMIKNAPNPSLNATKNLKKPPLNQSSIQNQRSLQVSATVHDRGTTITPCVPQHPLTSNTSIPSQPKTRTFCQTAANSGKGGGQAGAQIDPDKIKLYSKHVK